MQPKSGWYTWFAHSDRRRRVGVCPRSHDVTPPLRLLSRYRGRYNPPPLPATDTAVFVCVRVFVVVL